MQPLNKQQQSEKPSKNYNDTALVSTKIIKPIIIICRLKPFKKELSLVTFSITIMYG